MKDSSTKKILYLLVLLVVILALAVGGAIYFLNSKNIQVRELMNKVDEGTNNSILLQSIKSAGRDSDNEISRLNNLAVNKDDLVNFIENLEALGKSMNIEVKINSVTVEDGKGDSDPDKIHIKIETTGDWDKTLQYLHGLENLPYRVSIDSSSFSVGETTGDFTATGSTTSKQFKNIWNSNSEISVYSFN